MQIRKVVVRVVLDPQFHWRRGRRPREIREPHARQASETQRQSQSVAWGHEVAGLYIYYGWSIDQWSIMSSAAFNGVFSLTSFIMKFVFDGCTQEAWAVHCHKPAGEREEEDRDNADLT